MKTEAEIRMTGMQALVASLGLVETERFLVSIVRKANRLLDNPTAYETMSRVHNPMVTAKPPAAYARAWGII